MKQLTEKQIKTIVKLLALEIPVKFHVIYKLDMDKLGVKESVEEYLIRRMIDGGLHTVVGTLVNCDKVGMDIMEFNALDRQLMKKFESLVSTFTNDSYISGVPVKDKNAILEYITDIPLTDIQDYIDVPTDDIGRILKAIYKLVAKKIDDFEL